MKDATVLLALAQQVAGSQRRTWVRLSELEAALASLPDITISENLVQGLNAQAWHETARRYNAGLRVIANTYGKALDIEWARGMAKYYLGESLDPGAQVWVVEDGLVHIAVPGTFTVKDKIQPMPQGVSIKPGESVTLELKA